MKGIFTVILFGALSFAAHAQEKTAREQAGLLSVVQSVRTEVVEFAPKGGRGVERKRAHGLLERMHLAPSQPRRRQRRRVRQVEDLGAELDVANFVKVRALDEGNVGRAVAGAAHGVARAVAECELRRDGEGRGVEPARDDS